MFVLKDIFNRTCYFLNSHIILVQNKTPASCQALFARDGSEVSRWNGHKAVSSDNDKAVVYIDI